MEQYELTWEVLIDGSDGLSKTAYVTFRQILFLRGCYLQCIIQQAQSPSTVSTAVYSIDWAHSLTRLSKLSDHTLVGPMLSASKRILGKTKTRKEPVTPNMLLALVTKFKDNSSLYSLRTIALCLIGFTGFFCFSEVCGI